jgi:ribosome-binding protein aMBF1 (putative translation factor)
MVKKDKRVSKDKTSYKPATGNKVSKGHAVLLKSVGARIEEIRKQKDISVSDLCTKVKMSRTTYYRMINGMIYFNTEKFFKVLDILETDVSFNFESNTERKS